MNVKQLHYVVTLAETGSFRRAAELLNVRQSTVSRAIRDLEDRLGVSLFERNHTGARPTDAGQRFLAGVRPAIEQLESAVHLAAAAGRAEVGVVRIGILTSLGSGFLRELIRTYTVQRPGVRLEIREGSRDAHIASVRRHLTDIAFLVDGEHVHDCEASKLWHERIYVALPKDHRLARRRILKWSDLGGESFLVSGFAAGPEVHSFIMRRAGAHGLCLNVSRENVVQETLMNLVGLGLGVTLVSSSRVKVKQPNLAFRPLKDEDASINLPRDLVSRKRQPITASFHQYCPCIGGSGT